MLVIAHHHISDPENFWAKAQEVTSNLPDGLKVLGVFPAKDGKTGTCLWEADNVDDVQAFLDKYAGAYSENYTYELDEEKSVGLPRIRATAAEPSLS
ncbi:MAG TPA: hypothetical protein VM871_06705 [Flavisolibacter sp.]|nr:hypothetical protein [Flavisolibacter sp.]